MTGRPGTTGPVPLLAVRDVSKRFGATQALSDVTFDVRPGEVHALTGENGAGKSTLMKIISGTYTPDTGQISVCGRPVSFSGPAEAAAAGIAIIHQELSTIPAMSVAENLALGAEPTRFGVLDRRTMLAEARRKLALVGAEHIDPRVPVGRLSVGMQQMVEIAHAVAQDAQVLVLDEPTAALSQAESERLFELIEKMRADGMGLVYISHRMDEVWRLADRVSVFRDGRHVGTREKSEVRPDEIVHLMVGRDIDDLYGRAQREPGAVRLEVTGLRSADGTVGPVDLQVRAGEVVSLVGLVGAGRTEIARLVYGADRAAAGTVRVDGTPYERRSPRRSLAVGVALLPEDRKDQALFMEMSVTANVAVSTLSSWRTGLLLLPRRVAAGVAAITGPLRLKAASGRTEVRVLSGGNQQKVVLARMLAQHPHVLILDEPTRGVDIGAKSEIYRIVDEAAAQGTAVLVISSDLPEALGISDRVLVVRGGVVVAELSAAEADEETVMEYATGVAAAAPSPLEESR